MFWHMDVKSSSSNCSGRFEMRTVCVETFIMDRFSQEHSFEVVFYFYAVVVVVVLLLVIFITNVIHKSIPIYYKKFSLEKLNHD